MGQPQVQDQEVQESKRPVRDTAVESAVNAALAQAARTYRASLESG